MTDLRTLRETAGLSQGMRARLLGVDPAEQSRWEVGRRTLTGGPRELAESLRAYSAMGVHQIQVRFRSRSRGELIDQIAAFGAEVAPEL